MNTNLFARACCGNEACEQYKHEFLMRFEEIKTDTWVLVASVVGKEQTDQADDDCDTRTMKGEITISGSYSGCPYCGAKNIMPCLRYDGRAFCWEGKEQFPCPWCDRLYRLGGTERKYLCGQSGNSGALAS